MLQPDLHINWQNISLWSSTPRFCLLNRAWEHFWKYAMLWGCRTLIIKRYPCVCNVHIICLGAKNLTILPNNNTSSWTVNAYNAHPTCWPMTGKTCMCSVFVTSIPERPNGEVNNIHRKYMTTYMCKIFKLIDTYSQNFRKYTNFKLRNWRVAINDAIIFRYCFN